MFLNINNKNTLGVNRITKILLLALWGLLSLGGCLGLSVIKLYIVFSPMIYRNIQT